MDVRDLRQVVAVLVPVVARGKCFEIAQCCVVGIKYIISDRVVHHAADQSLAEVARSHRQKRNHVPDLVPSVLAHVSQIAVEAKRPSETGTAASAKHRNSPRESPDLGKLTVVIMSGSSC